VSPNGDIRGTYSNGYILWITNVVWYCWAGKYRSSSGDTVTITYTGETVVDRGSYFTFVKVESPAGVLSGRVEKTQLFFADYYSFWGDTTTREVQGTIQKGIISFGDVHATKWTWISA